MSAPRIVDSHSNDPQPVMMSDSRAESGDTPQLLDEGLIAGSLHLVRRAGVVLVIQVAGAGLSYGLQVLLARLLNASYYGIYTYVFVWASFVALVAGIGFPAASVRFLPVYRLKQDWPRLRGFLRVTSRATFATAITIALGGVAVAEGLHALGMLGSPSAIALGALLVPALAGSILYTEFARAGNRVGVAFTPPLVVRPALIAAGAAIFFVIRGKLSTNAALDVSLVASYAVLVAQYVLTRNLFGDAHTERHTVLELREWFGVGMTLLAASAFTVILMQVDIIVVGAVRGSRDAGIYAAASKTAALVAFVIMAVNAAAAPQFASLWAMGRVEDLQHLVTKLAGVIFWPSLAISAGIAALSVPLLDLFGPAFEVARPALLVLLVGQLVNAAAGSVGYLLILTGYHREATVALGLSAIACIVLTVVGVSTLGLVGAALGSMVGLTLLNGSLYWLVVRRLGIHPSILTALSSVGHHEVSQSDDE